MRIPIRRVSFGVTIDSDASPARRFVLRLIEMAYPRSYIYTCVSIALAIPAIVAEICARNAVASAVGGIARAAAFKVNEPEKYEELKMNAGEAIDRAGWYGLIGLSMAIASGILWLASLWTLESRGKFIPLVFLIVYGMLAILQI